MFQFQAELTQVFTGAQTSLTSRWVAANWIDKVLFATPSVVPIYWTPGLAPIPTWGECRPIPGLPDQTGYNGVEVFAGHVILWKGTTIKGSDLNDFAQWIPVAISASVGRALTAGAFVQPAVGSVSEWIFFKDLAGSFVEGQFVRIVTNETIPSLIQYSYYTVEDVVTSEEGTTSVDVAYSVPPGVSAKIYTDEFKDWVEGSTVEINEKSTTLIVESHSRDEDAIYTLAATTDPAPDIGGSLAFSLTTFPSDLKVGDYISVSPTDASGQDIYVVTSHGQTILCQRIGVGESMLPQGDKYLVEDTLPPVFVRFQHWVQVLNRGSATVEIPAEAITTTSNAVKLRNLGYSGSIDAGSKVQSGSVIETIGTNEATEIENVGALINGEIYAIVTLADYAYILKRDSIQSMQYVGGTSPYAIRAEIFDEGLIGRYSFCRFNNRELVFWGHNGWHRYAGGQVITTAGQAHWRTVYEELDMSRSDEIVAFHNREQNEVWFVYPVLKSFETKVVIYDYESDSVVVDVYSEKLNGITALGNVDWEVAPTWESLSTNELFNDDLGTPVGVDDSKRWYEYVDEGMHPRTLIGIGGDDGNLDNGEDPQKTIPRLLAHGRVYYRASRDDCEPEAYTAMAETPDFDFEDGNRVKYVDTVKLELFVPNSLPHPMRMWIQLGTRMNLDGAIRWSSRRSVEVSGNGNVTTKVDIRGSGRMVRLRFISDAESVQWQISSYTIFARMGGEY